MSRDDYESIVSILDRPVLVLAGPGAGKTYLLGDRTKRLLTNNIDKDTITLLTFGKEASQNMRNKLLDPRTGFGIPFADLPHVATIHSLGFEIVNRNPRLVGLLKSDLKVQENDVVKALLFRDAALVLGKTAEDAEDALERKQFGDFEELDREPVRSICQQYWDIMSRCNRIDFDDQVIFACRILKEDPIILKEFQQRCQHLLVDEYQDINAAQFLLINLLSAKSRNGLFAVGDDAQSIYGFRGASPEFILRFENDYPGASKPPLAHSRRCHKLIMDDAARILKTYYRKWTGPFDLEYHVDPSDQPFIFQVPSDNAEAEWVARIARQTTSEKKSVLVLAPKRQFFPRISQALRRYGVPHGCPVNLLSDPVNERLTIATYLLSWLEKPNDNFLTRMAIESLLNHGITKVPGANRTKQCSAETIAKRIEIEIEVAGLWALVTKKISLYSALLGLDRPSESLAKIGQLLSTLLDLYNDNKAKSRGEFAKQLSLAVGAWAEPKKLASDLASMIEELLHSKPGGFGSVQLMTMRKAKGLEADVVVIIGLEDDLMPNPGSDLQEEARLFYVSMTRAKEKLYLLHAFKRLRSISYGPEITDKKRSRFLDVLARKSKYLIATAKTS
jgi:DNA helicase-2/ATP-dependent DNA helicase PcrA